MSLFTPKISRITAKSYPTLWNSLNNKIVKNNCIDFYQIGDIHPVYSRINKPPIFLAEKIYLRYCDKNFIYKWMDKSTFPQAKEIYLFSHPCDYGVMDRFPSTTQIYLDELYRGYKWRWAK